MSKRIDYPAASDEELVRAAQGGDMSAFEELVARHRDKVYSRAYSMVRNPDDALDLSQEAWSRAWTRLKQFHGDASFLTWVTRITINLCLDHLRRGKRWQPESFEQIQDEGGAWERRLPVVSANPTEGLERAELRELIDQALARLPDIHRAVVVLYEFEELEYREIAQRLGCSIGTVMSRLFYARRKLAGLLDELREDRRK
jgi:RNA polymerase sigma-70 factor (ECF subfamily)